MFFVRVEFEFRGQRLYELVGPFDRWLAENVCEGFAFTEYLYGMTYVRVERARIVPA